MMKRRIARSFLLLIALPWLGCNSGSSGPPTVSVTGVVTFEDKPVEGALVLFYPSTKGTGVKTGSAETDASGTYAMQTRVEGNEFKDGIQPASYQVAIEKLDHSHRDKNPHAPPKNVLPSQYRDPSTSGLTAEVSESGENRFDFVLE